jgi:bacterial/archaeal transporter family protein
MRYFSLVLLGIITFGFAAFFRKLSVERLNPYQQQMISGMVYIVLIPLWAYIGGGLPKISNENYSSYFFAIMTTLCGIVGAVVFSFLLKGTNEVGVTSALLSLSPIITLALSFMFFHESISFWKILAFILALASAILVRF